jgi:hypothetical protein
LQPENASTAAAATGSACLCFMDLMTSTLRRSPARGAPGGPAHAVRVPSAHELHR